MRKIGTKISYLNKSGATKKIVASNINIIFDFNGTNTNQIKTKEKTTYTNESIKTLNFTFVKGVDAELDTIAIKNRITFEVSTGTIVFKLKCYVSDKINSPNGSLVDTFISCQPLVDEFIEETLDITSPTPPINVNSVVREGLVIVTNNDGYGHVCNRWQLTGTQDPKVLFKEVFDFPQEYWFEIDINVSGGSEHGSFPKLIVSEDMSEEQPNNYTLSYDGPEGGLGSISFSCGTRGVIASLDGTLNGTITGNYYSSGVNQKFSETSSLITFEWPTRDFKITLNGVAYNSKTRSYKQVMVLSGALADGTASPDTMTFTYRIWKKAKVSA